MEAEGTGRSPSYAQKHFSFLLGLRQQRQWGCAGGPTGAGENPGDGLTHCSAGFSDLNLGREKCGAQCTPQRHLTAPRRQESHILSLSAQLLAHSISLGCGTKQCWLWAVLLEHPGQHKEISVSPCGGAPQLNPSTAACPCPALSASCSPAPSLPHLGAGSRCVRGSLWHRKAAVQRHTRKYKMDEELASRRSGKKKKKDPHTGFDRIKLFFKQCMSREQQHLMSEGDVLVLQVFAERAAAARAPCPALLCRVGWLCAHVPGPSTRMGKCN